MFRKMLGLLTALVTTLAVVGVAGASSDAPATANAADRPSTTVTSDDRTTSTADGSTSTTSGPGSSTTVDRGSTTTTVRGSTTTSVTTPSTTIPGSTSTTNPGSTSTTTPGSTSTTTPGTTTSTSIDDDDPVPDGDYSFTVATAGTVVIRVSGGNLSLLSVTPKVGWSYEVDKNRFDVVEVEFTKGRSEASIKVEPGDGELEVEIEFKTG